MKNYPLLKTNITPYNTWNNNYLKELNDKVWNLHYYSNMFIPDMLFDNTFDNTTTNLDLSSLKANSWVQTTKETTLLVNNQVFGIARAGSYVYSKARAEGEVDNSTAQIKKQSDFYFWVPGGWGSYYQIESSNQNNQLVLSILYDKYAEEKYGLSQTFSIDWYNCRYYWIQEDQEWLKDYGRSIQLTSIINNQSQIIASNKHIWSNINTNPIMHELYLNNNNKYEEIDIDSNREISKVAKTNIANYTIVLKNSDAQPTMRVTII